MPLIKCPDCAREVSDKAIDCPQCGLPIHPRPKLSADADFKFISEWTAGTLEQLKKVFQTEISDSVRNRLLAITSVIVAVLSVIGYSTVQATIASAVERFAETAERQMKEKGDKLRADVELKVASNINDLLKGVRERAFEINSLVEASFARYSPTRDLLNDLGNVLKRLVSTTQKDKQLQMIRLISIVDALGETDFKEEELDFKKEVIYELRTLLKKKPEPGRISLADEEYRNARVRAVYALNRLALNDPGRMLAISGLLEMLSSSDSYLETDGVAWALRATPEDPLLGSDDAMVVTKVISTLVDKVTIEKGEMPRVAASSLAVLSQKEVIFLSGFKATDDQIMRIRKKLNTGDQKDRLYLAMTITALADIAYETWELDLLQLMRRAEFPTIQKAIHRLGNKHPELLTKLKKREERNQVLALWGSIRMRMEAIRAEEEPSRRDKVYEEVIPDLERYVSLVRGDVIAQRDLSELYILRGQHQKAVGLVRSIIDSKPQDGLEALDHFLLASAQLLKGESPQEERKSMEESLSSKCFPPDTWNFDLMEFFLKKSKDVDDRMKATILGWIKRFEPPRMKR